MSAHKHTHGRHIVFDAHLEFVIVSNDQFLIICIPQPYCRGLSKPTGGCFVRLPQKP